MDVELYVYDLSRGMARQVSLALTGIQIDAIYHTAIVLNNVEYFFGQGIHRKIPGSTHHGRPMSVVKLGQTELPLEVIEEYVTSLESIYTPESYDLFLHNCNNFSQDLAMFLVGKSIPNEISSLPETFLRTPMGQMLKTQLDQSMRQMTQAPDALSGQNAKPAPQRAFLKGARPAPAAQVKPIPNHHAGPIAFINAHPQSVSPGKVHNITSTSELDRLLQAAKTSCAVIFFTSVTCPPCKLVYPAYDQLAEEAGDRGTLIKVDISKAYDVGMRYSVRATPTFITFLRGEKQEEWSGAHEARLRGNVRSLLQMATPRNAHSHLDLPSFHSSIQKPIMYAKVPPLDKLLAKLGKQCSSEPSVKEMISYLKTRNTQTLANTPLPNLQSFSTYLTTAFPGAPAETRFALIDLLRIAAADPRVSSFFAAESPPETLATIIPPTSDYSTTPYNIQVTTLQLACNLFSSNIFQEALLRPDSELKATLESLASQCLLAQHWNTRLLAGVLVYDFAAYRHNEIVQGRTYTNEVSGDVEAALLEAIMGEEENKETLHMLLLGLGMLLYGSDGEAGIWQLCAAMELKQVLAEKAKAEVFKGEPLLREVRELLEKGESSS